MTFLIPLFVSLIAIGSAVYYFQRAFHGRQGTVEARALSNKILKVARTHLMRAYGALTIFILALSGVIFVIPKLGWHVAIGFLLGSFVSLGVVYFVLLFFSSLKARVAERSSRGLIDAFHSTLEGGAFLSIFLFGATLLVLSVYYLAFRPLSVTNLAGLALGGVLTTFLLKMINSLYAHSALAEETFSTLSLQPEPRNPETIVELTGHMLTQGLSVVVDVFETMFMGLVGVILAASLVFPGVSGAVVLPLFLFGTGFIVSLASTRLIRMGATTALVKNILFVVLASIVLASLFSFPLIAWLLGENAQYGIPAIWGAAVLGFVSGGSIVLVWLITARNKFSQPWIASALLLFAALTIAAASSLADVYGVVIMLVSILSFSGTFITFNVLAAVSESASAIGKATTPHQEHTKILERLAAVSPTVRGSIHVFLLLSGLYVATTFFLLYQQIGTTSINYYSNDATSIIGSMFFGGGGLAFLVAAMMFLQRRVRTDVHDSSKITTKGRGQREKRSYLYFTQLLSHSTVRVVILPLCIITALPILVAVFGRAAGLGGFLLGTLSIGAFWAASLIRQSEHIGANGDTTEIKQTIASVQPSLLAGIIISTMKMVAVLSLLLAAFFA